jgi:3-hydroxy acid dehydrogenase / malonic semialdehyde reductase
VSLAHVTAFVTGATSGFGEATAKLLLKNGARVIATGRRKERLEALGSHENLHTIQLDVRDQSAVEHAVAILPEAFKNVDVLVNNAGLALNLEGLECMSDADVAQMIDTNINGVIYCTKALLPQMIARDNGHIINMGSIAGNYPYPGGNVYGATKAFVKQFSLNLRADLLGKNIRVTNIEPGMADTEFSLVRFHGDKPKADKVYAGMQALSSEDVAEAVLWAISRPKHVNINQIELMPTMQAFSPFAVARK